MDFLFLGTGAADFSPLLEETPGPDLSDPSIRRSTATLLDGELLFDCGPHLPQELALCDVRPGQVKALLQTHFHTDHFNLDSLQLLADAAIERETPLHVYFRADGEMPALPGLELHPVVPGETVCICGYTVTAVEANHAANALHYSVEKDGCRLFYGLDGAWVLNGAIPHMQGKRYDVMVLDATVGDYEGDYRVGEHNSIPMLRMMEKSFRTLEICDDKTLIVLDHIARTLHKPHDELCRQVQGDGYLPAYDGMRLSVQAKV